MGLFSRSRPTPPTPTTEPVQRREGAAWSAQRTLWSDPFGRLATRCLQVILVVLVAAALVFAMTQLSLVVIPVVLALIIASAMYPLLELMRRRGMPSMLATWIALVAVIVVLGLIVWLVVEAVQSQFDTLVHQATKGLDQLQSFLKDGPFQVSDKQIQSVIDTAVKFLQSSQFSSGALAGLSAATSFVTGLALFVVVLFFFMKDGPVIWRFLLRPFTGEHYQRATRIGAKTVSTLGGYVRGTATVALVDALGIGIGLFVIGVPLAIPLAVIVFISAFVPLVGATVAGILAALVALVANGPVAAIVVVAIVVAVNQLEGNFLQPVVMARSLKLHPLVVLLALTAGTLLGGIIGAILSVPVAAVAWGVVTVWNGPEHPAEFARRKRPEPKA
ncbi:AI-2E family transporter [Frondihabitans australicus]|uniref:Putative PurR-regulated permease PerM n=1 Tax=Frondihabitans australicus TaxID=386892 RepID=A0A495IHU2_9MICO|nr:AI-2E family transporter [Frondihabitans australicus]RKR75349.1 putative PurR-regulated permease PerM [Frondihabitans australicus]